MPNWKWPLWAPPLLPDAPGSFGYERAHDIHTGVDLYCAKDTIVTSVEAGTVIGIQWFTGKHAPAPDGRPSDWWNDTKIILVKGESGVIGYGEVTPKYVWVKVGEQIGRNHPIGAVSVPVLRYNRGRPMFMLHIELLGETATESAWWQKNEPQPEILRDPTPYLKASEPDAPVFDLTRYDGRYVDPKAERQPSRWWTYWGGKP